MGDINDNVMGGAFTMMLMQEGVEMDEFGGEFCGEEEVDSYVYGNGRIAGGWKTKNLEITQLIMFPFMESVGDHRSWIVEFTTRSVLGVNLVKIQRSVGRRLVSTNEKATSRYNELVRKLFEQHNIVGRMKDLLCKSETYCFPGPEILSGRVVRVQDLEKEVMGSASNYTTQPLLLRALRLALLCSPGGGTCFFDARTASLPTN